MTLTRPTFEEWWEKYGKPYEAAVIAGGGTPWPLDPEKRSKLVERMGLPADIDSMELRRMLWERGHRK